MNFQVLPQIGKSLGDAFDLLIKQYKERLDKKIISETTVSKYEITYGYVNAVRNTPSIKFLISV
ncbi:MAG TPA: hypothetical protein VL053_02220 [Arachidicoccus sp.]|nr:hypothetical protein [Arachidicoccus sp.]